MLLKLLFSHYRQHPLQAVFLLIGVVLANTLLVGVQVINAQARSSYAQSERELGIQPIAYLRPAASSQWIPQQAYIDLRRQGFDRLVPLVQHWLTMQDGQRIPAMGVDPIAASGLNIGQSSNPTGATNFSGWFTPPGQTWVASARAKQLGWQHGTQPITDAGQSLPPVVLSDQAELGHRIVMDIGYLQRLIGHDEILSEIAVLPLSDTSLEQLKQALPPSLVFEPVRPPIQTAQMTDSFHLNLTAMALLSLVVGGFLIYNAITFSLTDRLALFIKMRLAGVTRSALRNTILVELILFTIAGLLVGYLLGFVLAAQLLPGLGKTLTELYGVFISYPDSLLGNLSLLPVGMTVLVVALTAWGPLTQQLNAPLLPQHQSHWQANRIARRDHHLLLGGLLSLSVSLVMCQLSLNLLAAFICMAALLLGVALITPWLLRQLLNLIAQLLPKESALAQWVIADSRWLLGPAAVAIMAMVLVLVANSGLNTLIFSFRTATIEWLDHRLAAPLYLRPQQKSEAINTWLTQHYPEMVISKRFSTTSEQGYTEIATQPQAEQAQQRVKLVEQLPQARLLLAQGQGLWISERAQLKSGLSLGHKVQLCHHQPLLPVVGVYRDYGNPLDQWMVDEQLFMRCFPNEAAKSWALSSQTAHDWQKIQLTLKQRFDLNDTQIINQHQIHKLVLAIFDQTFSVAKALNGLTLIVAAIGIFCATSAIHHHRLKQQALLAALGIEQRQRLQLLFAQWGIIGTLMLLLVWPFGQSLAWILTYIVTPAAFGWRFPALWYTEHYPALVAVTLIALFIATVWPAMRLARANLVEQLKEERG